MRLFLKAEPKPREIKIKLAWWQHWINGMCNLMWLSEPFEPVVFGGPITWENCIIDFEATPVIQWSKISVIEFQGPNYVMIYRGVVPLEQISKQVLPYINRVSNACVCSVDQVDIVPIVRPAGEINEFKTYADGALTGVIVPIQ